MTPKSAPRWLVSLWFEETGITISTGNIFLRRLAIFNLKCEYEIKRYPKLQVIKN